MQIILVSRGARVITADFEASVNLEKLSEDLNAIYEPEQFPGAIITFEKPFKSTILFFVSGKAVITGLQSSKQIDQTIQKLKNLCYS